MRTAQFETVGLDDLNANAALQTRVDRKYVLPRAEAELVLASLDPSTRVLEIDGVRALQYESVYFDTPDLLSYRMAATARRRRFKLRTRSYVDTAEAYLEMKTRGARSTTVKERLAYDMGQRGILTPEGRQYADAALDGLGMRNHLDLWPTLITRYLRTTLYTPASGSRATVDTDLSWEVSAGSTLSAPELAIIETKSAQRIGEVDRALWARGHRPDRISKYGTGLAALRPDLPSNKWARVLRRHFS